MVPAATLFVVWCVLLSPPAAAAAHEPAGDGGETVGTADGRPAVPPAGARIKPLPWEVASPRLLLNLGSRTLTYFGPGGDVRTYAVAIGRREKPTPTGDYHVAVKLVDPVWWPPDGGPPVQPGPDNPLGSRWLGLSLPRYGIHGTNAPGSIGRAVSRGCVRLYDDQARELFDLVPLGTPVRIVYETVAPEAREGLGPAVSIYPDTYRRGTNALSRVLELLAGAGIALADETGGGGDRPAGGTAGRPGATLPFSRADLTSILAAVEAWGRPVTLYSGIRMNGELVAAPSLRWGDEVWVPVAAIEQALGVRPAGPDAGPAGAGQAASETAGAGLALAGPLTATPPVARATAVLDGRRIPAYAVNGRQFVDGTTLVRFLPGSRWSAGPDLPGVDLVLVYVNGRPVGATAFVADGRTFVPLRRIAETLDHEVVWDQANRVALVNGTAVSGRLVDDRLHVPLRQVAELLGATVNWDPERRRVDVVR